MGRALATLFAVLGVLVSCAERYGDASGVDAGAGEDASAPPNTPSSGSVTDSGVDAPQTPSVDASQNAGTVHCGLGVMCTPRSDEDTCCVNGSACDTLGQCQCVAASACNSPRHYSCDDATDCPAGLICCGVFENMAGGLLLISASCLSQASCAASTQRGELCDPASPSVQCPTTMKCAASSKFPGIGLCIR